MVFARYSEVGGKEGMSRSLFFGGMYRLIAGSRPSSMETSAAPMQKPKTRKECQGASHRPTMEIKILVLEKE